MPRPPLPIGTWGSVRTQVVKTDDNGKALSHRAQAKFRDHDGRVRLVSAFGRTKTAATNSLLTKLKDRAKTGHSGELTALHKVDHLLELWVEKFEEQVADGQRSPTSLDTYRRAIKNHVRPAVGELRIGETTTPRLDKVIAAIKKKAGPPTARTSRAVISGMMQLAVRYGAISVNPVREVDRIEHPTKKLPEPCARTRSSSSASSSNPTKPRSEQISPTWSPSCSAPAYASAKPSPSTGPRSTSMRAPSTSPTPSSA